MSRIYTGCIIVCIAMAGMLFCLGSAHAESLPGPDCQCHFPFAVQDSQGFCWGTPFLGKALAERRYTAMRSRGETPPVACRSSASGQMHIPDHANEVIGKQAYEQCLQMARSGAGVSEQACTTEYKKRMEAGQAIKGYANGIALANPLTAMSTDPMGSFCEKVRDLILHKIPIVGEGLEQLAKTYGTYDSLRKGFQQRLSPDSLKDRVREACHLR